MQKSAAPDGWLRPALIGVLAITAARVLAQWLNRADLFVDEAQYWLWGQELALGYYSKPPLIGWVIRAVTDLAGSDAPFWVRLPAPLFHGATALILGALGARLFGARAGWLTALGYVTLPMVAVGSFLISTDTIMFPFLAGALLLYLRLLETGRGGLGVGALLGLAFMAKYAAVYYLLCGAVAAAIWPAARPGWRQWLLLMGAFAVVIAPNVWWNITNGLTTVQHTLDNADWVRDPATRAGLNLGGLGEFLGSQFAVFGPVLFAALLVLTWQSLRGRSAWPVPLLVAFAVPIVLLVCGQALLSRAYANWAAAAYLAGSVAVFAVLLNRRWLLVASFAINGAFSLFVPVAGIYADRLSLDGNRLLLARYQGIDELSERIIETARFHDIGIIVAEDRAVLADLFYTGRDSGLSIRARPFEGRPPHHYAQRYPLTETDVSVLYVLKAGSEPPCPEGEVAQYLSERGAQHGRDYAAVITSDICLQP